MIRMLTRTWVKVAALSVPESAGFEVGDNFNMTLRYRSDRIFGDNQTDQRVQWVNRIEDDPSIPGNVVLSFSGSERVYIRNEDQPGNVTVTLVGEGRNCTFEGETRVGLSHNLRLSIIGHPRSSVHTDHLIIRDDPSFVGPFWFGMIDCAQCPRSDNRGSTNHTTTNEDQCHGPRSSQRTAMFNRFEPADPSAPCVGGGIVSSSSPGGVRVDIGPDPTAIAFRKGDKCGCLFSTRDRVVTAHASPSSFTLNNDLPIYVEYDCQIWSGGPGRPPIYTDEDKDFLCELYGCEECELIEGDCGLDLTCTIGDVTETIPDVHLDLGVEEAQNCWVITSSGPDGVGPYQVQVGIPCAINPCSGRDFTFTGGNFGFDGELTVDELALFINTTPLPQCTQLSDCDFEDDPFWPKLSNNGAPNRRKASTNRTYNSTASAYEIAKQSVQVVIDIYPNPVASCGQLTIRSPVGIDELLIFTALGEPVLDLALDNQLVSTIPLNCALGHGIHLARITLASGQVISKKVIVK